jgi:hypothetical protein
MKVEVLGTVNGNIAAFEKALEEAKGHLIQLGDLGITNKDHFDRTKSIPSNYSWSFLAGNLDNFPLCNKHPHCLSQFDSDTYFKMLYISSGSHFDRDSSYVLYDTFRKDVPKVVISYDAPATVVRHMYGQRARMNAFNHVLDDMCAFKAPKKWIFGNCSSNYDVTIGGTTFHGVGSFEQKEIVL